MRVQVQLGAGVNELEDRFYNAVLIHLLDDNGAVLGSTASTIWHYGSRGKSGRFFHQRYQPMSSAMDKFSQKVYDIADEGYKFDYYNKFEYDPRNGTPDQVFVHGLSNAVKQEYSVLVGLHEAREKGGKKSSIVILGEASDLPVTGGSW